MKGYTHPELRVVARALTDALKATEEMAASAANPAPHRAAADALRTMRGNLRAALVAADPPVCKADEMQAQDFKALRLQLGLSQPQLAEMLGTSGQSVWRWEAGETQVNGMAARLLLFYCSGCFPDDWILIEKGKA